MTTKRIWSALLLALCLVVACNRDPNVAKKKYLDNGTRYFDNGKYKEAVIMYSNALKRDPRYGEAYYRRANTLLRLGRYPEALRDLQRSVELQPENLDAHTKLTNMFLNVYVGDRKKTKSILTELQSLSDRMSKRFPNTFEDARLKGYLALFDNDAKTALAEFEKANKLKPWQPDLILIYMQTLGAMKRADEGEKLAYAMLEKDPGALQIYDALLLLYARENRPADIERVLKLKIEKNPKIPEPRLQLAGHYFNLRQREPMLAALRTVSSNAKDFPNGLLLVGDFLMRIREFDLAGQQFQEGMDRDPKEKARYQKRLVEVKVRQNKKEEASQLVADVLKTNPKDDEAIAIRASLALLVGSKDQLQNAINDLQAVIGRMPDNPVLRYNLGRAYLATQNPSAARVQLEEAIKLRPDYIAARVILAELLLQGRDYNRTMQHVQEIVSLDPNNVAARLIRSRALIGMGQFQQARTELAQTTKVLPDLPEARLQMAALDFQEKNFKEAEGSYRNLYDKSQDPRALVGLVETYMAQGQFSTAEKLIREQLAKSPDRQDFRVALGNVLVVQKNYKGALDEFNGVLAKNPNNVDVLIRLGETQRRAGDVESAIATYKKAQQVAPNNVTGHVQLAMIYEAAGQRADAKPVYEQVLRLQPDNAIALNNLAFYLADNGTNLDQALTMAQKARQVLPNDPNVADTLGWIYIKKNLSDSAISIFRELVESHPQRPNYRYHLAMALFQKGDKVQAKRELEQALRAQPSKDEETKIRDLLTKV